MNFFLFFFPKRESIVIFITSLSAREAELSCCKVGLVCSFVSREITPSPLFGGFSLTTALANLYGLCLNARTGGNNKKLKKRVKEKRVTMSIWCDL